MERLTFELVNDDFEFGRVKVKIESDEVWTASCSKEEKHR